MQELNGDTPLHIAIKNHKLECALYLLNRGADSKIRNKASHAPIHQCVLSNDSILLDAFLSKTAKQYVDMIHFSGENGQTGSMPKLSSY